MRVWLVDLYRHTYRNRHVPSTALLITGVADPPPYTVFCSLHCGTTLILLHFGPYILVVYLEFTP